MINEKIFSKFNWTYFLNFLSVNALFYLIYITFWGDVELTILFRQGYYSVLTVLFFIWVIQIIRFLFIDSRGFREKLIKNIPLFILISIIAFCAAYAANPQFRVFNDEVNYASASLAMAELRSTAIIDEAYYYKGVLTPLRFTDLIRPAFFSYLVHLWHLVLGVRFENILIFNLTLFSSILFLIYKGVYRYRGRLAAGLSIIFVISQPAVIFAAASGGFELCNVFFMALVFFSLINFLRLENESSFCLLWIHLVLLAHIRPESLAYFFICIVGLGALKRIRFHYFKRAYFFVVTSLSFLPLLWQKMISKSIYPNIYHHKPDHLPPFGIINFISNTKNFLAHFFQFDFTHPHAGLINLVGVLAVIFFLGNMLFKWKQINPKKRAIFLICCLCGIFYWVLFNSYWIGSISTRNAGRFYVFPVIVFSIAAALLLDQCGRKKISQPLFIAFGIFCFVLYRPALNHDLDYHNGTFRKIHSVTTSFLNKNNDKRILLVSEKPKIFVIYGYSAIKFRRFNREKKQLLKQLEAGRFSDIVIAQAVNSSTKKPYEGNEISKSIRYEVLEEILMRSGRTMRFLRVLKSEDSV